MRTADIHSRLKERFGAAVGPLSEARVDPFCTVEADHLAEVCRFVRTDPDIQMDFLEDLTAVDWPQRSAIEVVYHLLSYAHRHALVLKVAADRGSPVVSSVAGVWRAASWFEREVYDLFGVTFTGHPDLRRILLPDDWVGHPLRKDYQEAGGWHGISNVRENPLAELKRLDEVSRSIVRAPGGARTGAAG